MTFLVHSLKTCKMNINSGKTIEKSLFTDAAQRRGFRKTSKDALKSIGGAVDAIGK